MASKNPNRKRYRLLIVAGAAFIAAWAIHQAFSLALLTITIFAGAQVVQLAWSRLRAKSHETEELSRIHFATAEALATAIDAKDSNHSLPRPTRTNLRCRLGTSPQTLEG